MVLHVSLFHEAPINSGGFCSVLENLVLEAINQKKELVEIVHAQLLYPSPTVALVSQGLGLGL